VTGAKFGACKLASGSRVSSHFHHTGEELFYRGTDKDNGEETDPHTLAARTWTLRREGCHNINWVGGEDRHVRGR
jgi:putative pyruvate formate lyase activating enzyme